MITVSPHRIEKRIQNIVPQQGSHLHDGSRASKCGLGFDVNCHPSCLYLSACRTQCLEMVAKVGLEPTRGDTSADFESAAAAITPLGLLMKMAPGAGLEPAVACATD